MMHVRDLRDSFIQFFREREHRIVPSSPLIPRDDPTLLFTTAGMVQFKPMFAGTVALDYTRAASVQKCFRTSDLENVGNTKRHCTFFEMLGNFSFGDYFKNEAIAYAWDYSTKVIGFDKKDIWVSIYEADDEAFAIWNKSIGVPAEKIVRLGKKDNFWGPAGDSGACGPCSELYLDRGPAFGCGSPDCKPGCECERFLEYWNLVFNQYFQDTAGNLSPLPKTGIDTGMGLERLATLVQNVDSIYHTDELKGFVDFVSRETKTPYEGKNIVPINVLVEHARALTFAMSDGAYPSNEGRGYVLRRILRRALRFGRQIGVTEPFVFRMVDPIVAAMAPYYPEIKPAAKNVKAVIEGEERRFLETLDNGMDRLDEIITSLKKSGVREISGRDAFLLYDTFGFPVEMTVEIAREEKLGVDLVGFEREMNDQRERGKKSWKGIDSSMLAVMDELSKRAGATEFRGYDADVTESVVTLVADANGVVDSIAEGMDGMIVAAATSFYGESGGQVGDRGVITTAGGARFAVEDTRKINSTVVHVGRMERGSLTAGDAITTSIDSVRRNLTRANHTATHLLQAALKSVLGEHVKQAGSQVDPERLRFDFSHFQAVTAEELAKIEEIVNGKIWENAPVETIERALEEAIAMGATAVFDEKYESRVRVVSVPGFSMKLCGGTHVDNTGKIGVFTVLRESSPGAGMRRIEALTLKGLLDRYRAQHEIIRELTDDLKVPEQNLPRRVGDLVERAGALEKELKKARTKGAGTDINALIASGTDCGGVKLISHTAADLSIDELRSLADAIRAKEQSCAVILGASADGKVHLLCAATKSAVAKGIDCGALVKEAATIVGGGGGGRKDMAQAGGSIPEKLPAAIEAAVARAKSTLA